MKKNLLLIPVAALAFAACTNDSLEFTGAPETHEISFKAISQPGTRAAIDGTTFPTALDMKVAAYQVSATGGSAGAYFDATTFKYQYKGGSASGSGSYWGGETAKYWPLTAAYINFLAIANANADNATGVTWGTNKADQVTIVMSDNSSAQRDLMYARGDGEVTQSGNALTFPDKVDMEFKHAQAWIDFKVKANSTTETAITVNSITLTGAKYNGTYTVTHTAYNANTGQSVAGAWSALGGAMNIAVPGWSATALTTSFATVGNGLMIVPDDAATGDFTSFTINYTYDGKTYTYTYTPASTQVEQAKHYIYEITFKLHEIFINPTVTDWEDQTINYVDVPTKAFSYVASTGEAGTYTLPSATAGTYSCTITGLPADTYTVEEKTDDGTDFITAVVPSTSVTLGAGDPLNISFTVSASSGNSRKIVIKNDEATPVTLFTLTVTQP